MVTSNDTTEATEPKAGSVSGADLARMALQSARAAGRRRGNAPVKAKAKRTTTVLHGGGREPVGFGAVLGALVVEGAWAAPVAGGSVVDQWAAIAPAGVADHLVPVRFDADAGRLDLRPDSAAYATLARLNSTDLLRRIAQHTGTDAVRHIRVLAPGPAPRPTPVAAEPDGERIPQQPAPVRTREDAAPGYHQARNALLATRLDKTPAAPVREAIERQTRALLEHREPERLFTKPVVLEEELRELEQQRRSRDVQRLAEQKARADRAARHLPTITPARASDSLGRTA
ncbi:DciA family protein [Streptacidiphilus sp. N1-3]|uniref:DciA family protein n=1 Tax=Streptacidiphilus alkalitolerans TaxID=3342712 RepID=A0ABV6XDA6_9ACTN